MRLIAGELYSSQSCRVLAVNAARTYLKSAVLRLFFAETGERLSFAQSVAEAKRNNRKYMNN